MHFISFTLAFTFSFLNSKKSKSQSIDADALGKNLSGNKLLNSPFIQSENAAFVLI